MHDLLKKKQEIDRLYKEAKAMEATVNTATQETIDKALTALGETIDKYGDSVEVFHTGIIGWIMLSKNSKDNAWVFTVSPPRTTAMMWRYFNGRWTVETWEPGKRASAEVIMYYWTRFMQLVKDEFERRIREDMAKKLDEVGHMVKFLQQAEKFRA